MAKKIDLSSLLDSFPEAKSGIHIKPSHKGRFTEYKKRTGKTTEEALHSKDPHVRKMAQFASNAKKWHHAEDGVKTNPAWEPTLSPFTETLPYNPILEQKTQANALQQAGTDFFTNLHNQNKIDSSLAPTSITPQLSFTNQGYAEGLATDTNHTYKGNQSLTKKTLLPYVMGAAFLGKAALPNDTIQPVYNRPEDTPSTNPIQYGKGSQAIMRKGGKVCEDGTDLSIDEPVLSDSTALPKDAAAFLAARKAKRMQDAQAGKIQMYDPLEAAKAISAGKKGPGQEYIDSNYIQHPPGWLETIQTMGITPLPTQPVNTTASVKKMLMGGAVPGMTGTMYARTSGKASSKKIQTAENGLKVHWGGEAEQLSSNPVDGGTVQFNGQSHEDSSNGLSGIGIEQNGTKVEVEGGETMVGNTVFGNMQVPGTNMKFKTASKKLADLENKAMKQRDKGTELINNADPENRHELLSFNSGMLKAKGAEMKQADIAKQKDFLSTLQEAILSTAKEHSLDANELSNGNIKKAKYGMKIAEDGFKNIGKYAAPKDLTPDSFYSDQNVVDFLKSNGKKLGADKKWGPDHQAAYEYAKTHGSTFSDVPIQRRNLENTIGIDKPVPYTPVSQVDKVAPYKPIQMEAADLSSDDKGFNADDNYWLPTNQESLKLNQYLPEAFAALNNKLEPVQAQKYTPNLFSPYQISLQDKLNDNQATFNASQHAAAYDPNALSTLAGQKYAADNNVRGEEFRTNQGIFNDVLNKNNSLINDASLKNLAIGDQQYTRQASAKAKTKAVNQEVLDSLSSKLLQNSLENKRLQAYESMTGARFVDDGTGHVKLVRLSTGNPFNTDETVNGATNAPIYGNKQGSGKGFVKTETDQHVGAFGTSKGKDIKTTTKAPFKDGGNINAMLNKKFGKMKKQ